MRKKVISFVVGMVVVLGVVLSLGPGGALAQGDPTPTINISGLLGGTPPAAGAPTQMLPELTLAAVTEAPGATPAPQSTEVPEASAAQLVWLRVESGFEPVTVNDVTVGGPVDTYAMVGDPCAQGVYAAELPVFEFHLLSDAGPLRIGFVADDGSATAMLMWDSVQETWWCNVESSAGSELSFDSMVAGDYPVYVAVQGGPAKITGQLYVSEG